MKHVLITTVVAGLLGGGAEPLPPVRPASAAAALAAATHVLPTLPAGIAAAQLQLALDRLLLQITGGGDPAAVQPYARAAEVALDRFARIASPELVSDLETVWLAIDQVYNERSAYGSV